MFYTILDDQLDKVFTGSFIEAHTWLESKTFKEVYYVFSHQNKTFSTAHEFWMEGV